MNNTLILSSFISGYFRNAHKYISEIYKTNYPTKIEKHLRKISIKLNIFPKYFLNSWFEKLDQYSTIILFDNGHSENLIKIIKKKNPNIRIIFWYWNPVYLSVPVSKIPKECEIWSYREADCRTYGLRQNTQFFIEQEFKDQSSEIIQDVYFLGCDKNRSNILYNLSKVLQKHNISYKFVLTKFKNSKESFIKYSNKISYEENIKNIFESKVVVDIVDDNQKTGVSLRPFESAICHRKLISNDCYLKNLQFYSPNNIFILGVDEEDKLRDFINTPYDTSIDNKLNYYEIKEWINRFFQV